MRFDASPSVDPLSRTCGDGSLAAFVPVYGHRADWDVLAISFSVAHVVIGVRWMYFLIRACASCTDDRVRGGQVECAAIVE